MTTNPVRYVGGIIHNHDASVRCSERVVGECIAVNAELPMFVPKGRSDTSALREKIKETADWLAAIIAESDPKPSELMAMEIGLRAALEADNDKKEE